ncbi:MAG: ABC transporter permease [Sphaerochaetaceae bacterium]|nr:ABC transporter permease [Sphaerochaetaceae bacterium]
MHSADNSQIKDIPSVISNALRKFVKANGSVVIFLILWIVASVFVRNFFSIENMLLIIKQAAIPTIACLGITVVLMTGGIDLSLGYTLGLCSISVGLFVKSFGLPIWLSIVLTLLIGIAVGLFNGVLVQYVRVPAFITTLGSGFIIFGLAQIISSGSDINRLPPAFRAIGITEFGGLNTTVVIAIVTCLVMYYVLHRSTFGRALAAFGFNNRTARMSGIKTERIKVMAYVIGSFLVAIAAILLTIRVNCAQPTMGGGVYTFEVITGAIIGGASLFGGVGTVIGSVFGILIVKIIENCINLLNVSYYTYQAFQGIVILLAIIFENVKNRKL